MSTHRVVVLALPSVFPFDLGIPTQIFNPRSITPYDLTVCGPGGSVMTSTGFTIGTTVGLSALTRADTIIVPGYKDYLQSPMPEVVAALRVASDRGTRIASICTGAFALAAAGLLAQRTVTTHWSTADDLEQQYPTLRVDRDVLYIDDGSILTSAGMTAGVDLCVHMVRKDLGATVANEIARELVASPHREGDQAQFIPRSLPSSTVHTFSETRAWAIGRLDEPLSLKDLASHARVSKRTLVRIWREETGTTPHQWVLAARLNYARELLETTNFNIDQVAKKSGLGTGTNFRSRFGKMVGTTPTAYRRMFHQFDVQR